MKKKTTYLIIFLLIFSVQLFAQFNRVRFLKTFYQSNAHKKIDLLSSLQPNELGLVYPFISDSIEKIKKEIYDKDNYKDLKFKLDKIEVLNMIYSKNHVQAILLLQQTLKKSAQTIDDSLAGLVLLKEVYTKIKNVNKALEMQFLIESHWSRRSKNSTLDFGVRKSYLLHLLGMPKEALIELKKEYFQGSDKTDTVKLVNFHNDLGVFYNQENNSDSASANLLKAKQLLLYVHPGNVKEKQKSHEFYKGLVDGNLGNSYFIKGNYLEAIPLLKNDANTSIKSDQFLSAFNAYHILSKCYIQLKDKKLSKLYLDTTQTIFYAYLNDVHLKIKLLATLADYYNLTQDFEKASETYKQYFQLTDSIQRSERQLNIINQGLAYDLNKTEFANEILEKQMKEVQLKEAKEKIFRISLLSGMLILLTVIFFLFLNNRRIKLREKQLSLKNIHIQNQNTQIENTLKEKEALIKEIHHRVKNNLQIITSMLNLQMDKIEDKKTENIFLEAKQRINAIALTHQLLYQKSTISEVNLSEYIEILVQQISATISSTNIQIETIITSSEQRMEIDGAVPLGLIINEIVTNSFKHAFIGRKTGKITVALLDEDDYFLIKISDDGIGLPENFRKSEKLSLGMELVSILVEQLETELIIESEKGSTFMFKITKNKHKLRS